MYICRVMNKALLSIGTNENREENLALCHDYLNQLFPDITYSITSVTAPYGTNYKNDFLNQLAIIYTPKAKEDIIAQLKLVEKKMGRRKKDKETGIVKIDIDLIMWNDEILKPTDISRSYIVDLLPSLKEK